VRDLPPIRTNESPAADPRRLALRLVAGAFAVTALWLVVLGCIDCHGGGRIDWTELGRSVDPFNAMAPN